MPDKPKFPNPIYFDERRYWRLSDLLRYEAECAGELPPPPLDPVDERYLTAGQVKARFSVSDMWLYRRSAKRETEATAPDAA